MKGKKTDLLAAGAKFKITIVADGTTSGNLFIPGGDEDGADYDADLTGTCAFNGETVTFKHSADTFIRDTKFKVTKDQLSCEKIFGDETISVVLSR